jgi:predicted dienelactone hydrolase
MLLPTFGISNTVLAAEKIYASYSILEIPISVMSLENFSQTGNIEDKLGIYQDYFSLQQLQNLQEIFHKSIKISPAVASKFLQTEQGEFLLERLAKIITNNSNYTESEISNLRAAIIAASKQPEGLNLLNLLRQHPSNTIHLNLANSLKLASELEHIVSSTNKAIATIEKISDLETNDYFIGNYPPKLSLDNYSNFTFTRSQLDLFDSARNRHLPTDIYLPDGNYPSPVIIISHGLGLNSSNFSYLGKHLASQGLTVVIPNHPVLLVDNKYERKFKEAHEFIERPLDIKYILDQLEIYNQSDPKLQGKLNLEQVGVLGQSLGGYTALALAGAKINFQQLMQDCQPDKLQHTWNMSLLLQCRALELLPPSPGEDNSNLWINLEDNRIKAAIAINPITSSIFGQLGLNQIQKPVMFIGSSDDTVAPALYEQIIPFSWLTHPNKYLAMLVGATHFSTIGNSKPGSRQISLPPGMVGNTDQAHHYINTLSSLFFQTYVSEKSEYLPFLNAHYAQTIADQSLGLSLIKSLNTAQIAPALDDYGKKNSLFLSLNWWGGF